MFSEKKEEGCSRRGAVCFKSLVLFTLLLYVCTAKPSKSLEQNVWSLTELLKTVFDSCMTYFSLGSAALSDKCEQKASVVFIRCTVMALEINLFHLLV